MAADAVLAKRGAATRWWLVAAFALLAVGGFCGLDAWVYAHVSLRLQTPDALDRDFYGVTKPLWMTLRLVFAHVIGAGAILAALLAWQPRRWRAILAAAIVVAVAGVAANVLQDVIGRLRPNQGTGPLDFLPLFQALRDPGRTSLPSGEATTALALAGVIAWLQPRWAWLALGFGVLAAGGRLVNGAHWFSDVMLGASFGLACAHAAPWLARTLGVRASDAGAAAD